MPRTDILGGKHKIAVFESQKFAAHDARRDALARGAHALLRHYVVTNWAEERERAFGQAVVTVQEQIDARPNPHPIQVAILADLMAAQARTLFKLARYADAIRQAERAASLARGVGAARPAALAHLYGGITLLYQSQDAEARIKFESALALARTVGWTKTKSDALRALGILYDRRED